MMRWLGRLLTSFIVLTGAIQISAPPATAQNSLRAAAVVNDDVISELDLHMRVRMVALSSGMQGDRERIRRIVPQVLRTLVNERIQLQEAERLDLTVKDEEIRKATAQIASRNNMSRKDFLNAMQRNGIMPETLRSRVRANIAWQKVLAREIRPQVNIGPDNVDAVIERREARDGQRLFRLREIFLPAEEGNAGQVRETAGRLIQDLRNGANFSALARQFSQSATAAVGGDLGWIAASSLPGKLPEAVRNMAEGSLAGPIQTFGGFYILALQDVREQRASETRVTLKQLLLTPAETGADKAALRTQAARLAKNVEGCGNVEAVAETAEMAQAIDLGELKLADMPEAIRKSVGALEVGETSEPLEAGGGVGVVVVCDRVTPGLDREQIRRNLIRQRMNMLAQRHMRNLRQQAYIEIRQNQL